MKKRILFTTIFSFDAIKTTVLKISDLNEIIYLVEENLQKDPSADAKRKLGAIENLKKTFGDIVQITALKIKDIYDIPNIISETIKKIDSLSKEDELFIDISDGRKTLAFGLLFSAYLRKDRISKIYYVIKERKELLSLPLLNFSINDSKKAILRQIMNGNEDKEKIREKLALGKSVIYQYINELKSEGYITNETGLKITDLGRIMVI